MSMTITVDSSTDGLAFANGVNLRVEVLRNAAVTQNGAAANSITAEQKAITTTVVGSRVYGAAINNNSGTLTLNGSTTAIDNISDTTNSVRYGSCKQTTDTASTGSETIGYTSPLVDGGIALYEVVPVSGKTLIEDLCAPAVVTNKTGKTATTAGFTPPQGSTLVVMASALTDHAFVISDTLGLTWTKQSTTGNDGTSTIWTARVPDPSPGDPYIAAIGGFTPGVTSIALAVQHDVAVGDVVILEMSNSSGSGSTVSDSQGNTYTFDQNVFTSQNNYNYVSKITTALTVAGGDTITPVRIGSTGQGNLIAVGIPNAIASSPVEGSSISQVQSGTSTAPSVTSGTLSQASEIIIACETNGPTGKAPVWSSPFDGKVLANEQIVASQLCMSIAWYRANATTAVTAAGTIAASTPWEMMLTAVKVSTSVGSISMHKMGLAASGGEKESGTGSVHMHKMAPAVTAATTSKVTATGSIAIPKMGTSDAGTEIETGTSFVAMHKMGLSGAGAQKFTATGSVAMHKMGMSDAGTEKFTATGSVSMHKMGLSSSGKETEAGTGSVSMHKMGLHGFNAVPISGSGSVAMHKMGLAALGDPASVRLDNSAEGGTNGTTVSTANSGGLSGQAFNTVTIGSLAAVTFDNTHPAHGSLGYKYVTGSPAANTFLQWSTALTAGTIPRAWVRKYFYFTANPSGNLRIMRALSTSTFRMGVAISSSGKVILQDAAGTTQKTSTMSVPLNAQVRLEAMFVGDASNGALECKIFATNPDGLVPDEVVTSLTNLNTGGTFNQIAYGNPSSVASYTFWGDDPAVSTRGYPGPVPMASVKMHKMGVAATGLYHLTLVNNFSGMNNGDVLSNATSGGVSGRAFDSIAVIPSGGTLAADNTHLGLDNMALKVGTTTTTGSPAGQWIASFGGTHSKVYFRVDCYKPVTATPGWRPIAFRTAGGIHVFSVLMSGDALSSSFGSAFNGVPSGTFVTHTPNGSYYRVEGYIDTVAASGTVYMEYYANQKDAVPAESHTYTGITFGADPARIDIGNGNSATGDGPFWIDFAGVSLDGPMSPPSVRMHKMGIAASGGEKESGTASVARHKMGIAASGHVAYGAVTMHKMGLGSSGKETEAGTGSVHMHKMGLSLSGKETEAGTGSVHMHKMGVAAAGTESGASGSISVHMHKMGLSSSGKETEAGTGSVRMHKMGLAESGVETFFGTGNARMHKMGLAGTAELKVVFHGTIAVRMHKMHILGQNPPIEKQSLFVFTAV